MKRTRLSKLLSLLLTLALLLPSLPAMAVDLGTVCQQHDWKVMETINPGMCGEEIVTYRYCDICGISDVVRKVIQHKFGDWKVVRKLPVRRKD